MMIGERFPTLGRRGRNLSTLLSSLLTDKWVSAPGCVILLLETGRAVFSQTSYIELCICYAGRLSTEAAKAVLFKTCSSSLLTFT